MDKLKQILESLTALEKLAQAEVDTGEFHLVPVLRSVQSAIVTTRQRIDALEQWAADQKSQKAAAEAEAKAKEAKAKQSPKKAEHAAVVA
jgi:hypothetical protein